MIDGNFGNKGTSNGTTLSASPVQSKPSVKSYNSGYLYHFIGQDIVSGENILNLEYLDDNFNQEPERVNKADAKVGQSDEPTLELPEDEIPF